jgi:hypothetical protein
MLKKHSALNLHGRIISSAVYVLFGAALYLFFVGQANADSGYAVLNKNTLEHGPYGDGRHKCLGIADRSLATRVANQWSCANGPEDPVGTRSQRWKLIPYLGKYQIKNINSGKCLTLGSWMGWGDGGHFLQYDCTYERRQEQTFNLEIKDTWYYKVTLAATGLCLGIDDRRTDNFNGGINQWTCVSDGSTDAVGRASQRWFFYPDNYVP